MSNIIVMAFSPRNIVGCFLKKGLAKGGGVTGTPGPPLPSLRPCLLQSLVVFVPCVQFGSHPYPFRAVLKFNVRFGVVTPGVTLHNIITPN